MKMQGVSRIKAEYPFKRTIKPIMLSVSAAVVLTSCRTNSAAPAKHMRLLPVVIKKEVNATKDVEPVEPAVAGAPAITPVEPPVAGGKTAAVIEPVTPGQMVPIGSCDTNRTKGGKVENIKPFSVKKQ